MSNTPKSFLELDDAPVKVQPNTSVFTNAQSLQPREGAVAKQDANGNWVNAIGLQSSASHRHVAKQWQAKCTPLADFIETVKSQSTNKVDVVKPESEIRLKDVDTLVDGTPLTDSGMNSLRVFADMPSSIISFLKEREYNDDLVKYMNAELDRRETLWNNKGKEKRTFNVRIRHDDEGNNVVRAIVSERYGVIDNHEAMEMVANALPSLTDALASHLFNDSDDIYGNILLPDYMKSEPDSDYGVGIAFKNSEIRNSTFKISPFLFRAICLNGMIWGRMNSEINVNQRHMGKIDLGDLQMQVTQAVKVALTQGNDMLTLLGYAKQVKVTNPVAVIAQLARDEKMTIEQGKLWHKGYLDSLHERHGDVHEKSAFGIINGLTRSAQDYTGSTREEMETLASKILAPAIDSSLQEISKRWGLIDARANQLEEKTSRQYQFVGV
ncbi:MAG: DUF932 domain-containing protein [Synechococcus lacustris]|nr:DUF932 domain-containing protein [Synechococcus lacustris]